jgi:hypothetical protein
MSTLTDLGGVPQSFGSDGHGPCVFTLAEGDSTPLGSAAAKPTGLASTFAIAAMFLGVLLVAWWYRRRLPQAAKAVPANSGEAAAMARDLSELVERLADELDRKAERVEQLLAAADERIRQLERMELSKPAASADRLIEPRPKARAETLSVETPHREVYALADAGLGPVDIARKLDRPTGQIELILNLRRGTVAI